MSVCGKRERDRREREGMKEGGRATGNKFSKELTIDESR